MDIFEKLNWKSVLIISIVIGLLSILATRKVLVGIGLPLILFVSWSMWKYIQDISKDN